MKLRQLLKDIPVVVRGSQELDIVAMTANSKMASPGCLFIAKRGKTGDGHRFILDAIAGGAIAILTDTYDPFLKVTQLIHSDVNQLEPLLGNRFYHHPSEKLSLFGVTGTSGKTTTTFLIHHLFKNCGLIGTVAWMTGKKILPSSHTTPDLLTLLHLLHEMEEEGCQSAAIEVSSHALDQGRRPGTRSSGRDGERGRDRRPWRSSAACAPCRDNRRVWKCSCSLLYLLHIMHADPGAPTGPVPPASAARS